LPGPGADRPCLNQLLDLLLLITLITHIHPDPYQQYILYKLSVRLGDSLKLILLLDSVRVGRSLGGVDELIGEALGDGL
jgi:hypothetical protein